MRVIFEGYKKTMLSCNYNEIMTLSTEKEILNCWLFNKTNLNMDILQVHFINMQTFELDIIKFGLENHWWDFYPAYFQINTGNVIDCSMILNLQCFEMISYYYYLLPLSCAHCIYRMDFEKEFIKSHLQDKF